MFKDTQIPEEYTKAMAEYQKEKANIAQLMKSDWQEASRKLSELSITKLTRELPVEAMYRLILNDQARKDKPLPSRYAWTGRRASDGTLVSVGLFSGAGAHVARDGPRFTFDYLGVCLSRMNIEL